MSRALFSVVAAAVALCLPVAARGTDKPQPADAPPAAATPASPTAPVDEPEATKTFAEVVKGAEAQHGLFTLWRKEGKVWLELLPEQLDRAYLHSATIESGIGERGFYGSAQMDSFAFAFRRVGERILLVRKNVRYTADANAPIHAALAAGYTDSILGSARLESRPEPKRKSLLVDLRKLFVADVPMLGYQLEAEYRWPYTLDPVTSDLADVHVFPGNLELDALLDFRIDRPPIPPKDPAAPPPTPPPVAPPDPRSLVFRVHYSLSALPVSDYVPRAADDRVGYFQTMREDFTDDRADTPYVRYIDRWRLEKADPGAPLSRPKQPIVFWIDDSVPAAYREPLRRGVLAWNAAFERIGFRDAIVVRDEPKGADMDPSDARYNMIRWQLGRDATYSIGYTRANPFTGEIYNAEIVVGDEMIRMLRGVFRDVVTPFRRTAAACTIGEGLAVDSAFAAGVLRERGLLASPADEERFLDSALTWLAEHEAGHALGLRHNFRATTVLTQRQVDDPATTILSSSVMDYVPARLARRGAPQGVYYTAGLGPYDFWAIEYGYAQLPGRGPAGEEAALHAIAARGAARELAYGTDEDVAYMADLPTGMDPRVNRWDLGDDPLAFYGERVELVHELWRSLESARPAPGKTWDEVRRSFEASLQELGRMLENATRYVGGVYHNREHEGDAPGRLPYEPVPAAQQRRALALVVDGAFGRQAFPFTPALVNRLAIEQYGSFEAPDYGEHRARLEEPVHDDVVSLQRKLLAWLYHPIRLARFEDLELRSPSAAATFTMADMFAGLRSAIWSELDAKKGPLDVPAFRRSAQREHLDALLRIVLHPAAGTPEDAVTLARHDLTVLDRALRAALGAGRARDTLTRAHLEESAARIREALNARLERQVPGS